MTKTVIIAAEDPNILYLLQRYAEESGLHAIRTEPNHTVAELAQRVRPAAIFLELDPACVTSHSILNQLRALPTTCAIPIVAYTPSGEGSFEPSEAYAAVLSESLLYDDFVAALVQAGVTGVAR
jgi:DNA-binding response OmpR family regulator